MLTFMLTFQIKLMIDSFKVNSEDGSVTFLVPDLN